MSETGGFLRTPRQLVVAGAACVAAFVAVLVVAYGSEPAAYADAVALEGFGDQLRRPVLARLAVHVARLANPGPFAVMAVALVLVALMRRRVREAAAAAVLLGGANVTTQALKPILDSPRGTLGGWELGPELFPSGHATASMSLALAAVLVAPRALRPLVALAGAVFAVAVGFALVAIDSHFPSDIAGGYLMAGAWGFGVQAVLAWARLRYPYPVRDEDERPGTAAAALVLLLGLTAGAAYGASRLPRLVDYAQGHTIFAVVAGSTAALATALVGATAASQMQLPLPKSSVRPATSTKRQL